MRHAALVLLAGPADSPLRGGALGLLVHDPGSRDRHLPRALDHFAAGDPYLPPGAVAAALPTHPEPVLEAFRARLCGPDTGEALRRLADATTPALAHRVAALLGRSLTERPEAAGHLAAYVDRRLDTDPAPRAVLLPLVTRLLDDGPESARAALAGFDVEAAAAAQHPACALLPADADAHGVATLVWHRRRPFHPERLYAALEDLTCAAARSRGRFWLAGKGDTLLHWDAAGGALCVEGAGPWLASLPDAAWELVPPVRRAAAALDWHPEHGDRCQHLVFTSPGLDRDGLERLLESCLLTDAEYAAGQAAWELLPPAFDTLLEV